MCTTFLKFNFSIQFYFSKAIHKLWLSVKNQLHVPLYHNLDLGINHRIGNPKQNSIEANVSIEVKTKHSFPCLFQKECRKHITLQKKRFMLDRMFQPNTSNTIFWEYENPRMYIIHFYFFISCYLSFS